MTHRSGPNLPSADDLAAESHDKALVGAYREFLSQLSEPQSGFILAGHEFFLGLQEDEEQVKAKVRLLACLLQADEDLLNKITSIALNTDEARVAFGRGKMAQDYPRLLEKVLAETYPAESGWPKDMRITFSLLFCLAESLDLKEFRFFSIGRTFSTILFQVTYAAQSPAASAERLACVDFDENWAVAVAWVDAFGFLPTILGFVRKDDIAGNVVRLFLQLPGEGEFLTGTDFDAIEGGRDGDQLLFDCFGIDDGTVELALAFLLPLRPEQRAKLCGEFDIHDSETQNILTEILNVLDVDELYARFGKPESVDYFADVRDRLLEDRLGLSN